MEYGFALIVPTGYTAGVHAKVIKKLIEEGYKSRMTSLISVSDFTEVDLEKTIMLAKKRDINLNLKKLTSIDSSVVIFVQGENATKILNNIALECDAKGENNVSCIYVSKSEAEAKIDLCEYVGVDDFTSIESQLFTDEERGNIVSFNFKALLNSRTK